MRTALWWIRNDQRINDQPVFGAIADGFDRFLVVYVIDEHNSAPTPFGFQRQGDKRKEWTLDSLRVLNRNLKKLGSHVSIFQAETSKKLFELCEEYEVEKIIAQKEYGEEERQLEEKIVAQGLTMELQDSTCLIHQDDLPFETHQLPETFTAFRKKVEKDFRVRSLSKTPVSLPPNPLPEIRLSSDKTRTKAGEDEGLKRLKYYLFESKKVSSYKQSRNELLGDDYSTRFSLWLANGNLSARMVYVALKTYEAQYGANESTYWVVFELLWRDYFKNIWKKHGPWLFRPEGILKKTDALAVNTLNAAQRKVFDRWMRANTGNDFCDAMIKELTETGFMSNRARQICASHLCHDLNIPWIAGAYWFENQLIDYDPCSNYGNWQYISGHGNDPRGGRHFNVEKQAAIYDPEKKYIKRWLS